MIKAILEWVKEVIVAVIIASIILAFVKPIIIRQSSMEPTFYNGDYVFISKQAYNLFGDPSHINFNLCLWQKEVALW